MSKNINVNPDHYKTRGREPQGQEVVHDLQRQKLTRERATLDKESAPLPRIPGTTGKKPDRADASREEDRDK
jgi:hypothetical protein